MNENNSKTYKKKCLTSLKKVWYNEYIKKRKSIKKVIKINKDNKG